MAISEKLLKPRIKQKFSEGVEQMYIPPIEKIQVPVEFDNTIMRVEKRLNKGMEEQVYRAVAQCEIVVNKEELLKALSYDREQYSKGYADALTTLREKCIEHQDFHKGDDGVFRAYISIEDLDVIIDEL